MKKYDEQNEFARIIANANANTNVQTIEPRSSGNVELLNHLVNRAVDSKNEDKLRDYGRRLTAIYLENFWMKNMGNSE